MPRLHREHLRAVYNYARHVDELGDSYDGDRLAALAQLREQVDRIWHGGEVEGALLADLAATVHTCGLSEQPFLDLIQANVQDQTVKRYATFADLVGYCRLSADPVGRIVLELFGQSTPERVVLSDKICTALQIVEHLQDVHEDAHEGRIYLPRESLATHGVPETELHGVHTSPRLRALVLDETARAEDFLREGAPLIGQLTGWAKLAVAGFAAGGFAVVDALRAANGNVMERQVKPTKVATARHAVRLLRGRHG